jgi:hypothetical protein
MTYILGMAGTKFSTIRRANFIGAGSYALNMRPGANYNRFMQVRAANSSEQPVSIWINSGSVGIRGNIFTGLSATNGGTAGFTIWGDVDFNVFNDVLTSNNIGAGIVIRGDSFSGADSTMSMNVFTRVSSVNNRVRGVYQWSDNDGPISDTIWHNALIAGNGDSAGSNEGYAFDFVTAGAGHTVGSSRTTIGQTAIAGNIAPSGGLGMSYTTNSKITGNFFIGGNTNTQCYEANGTNPAIDGTCAKLNASDFNLVTSGVAAGTGSFPATVTSDSTNTAENASGQSTVSNINTTPSNWFSFDYAYSFWGAQPSGGLWPSNSFNGNCSLSGTCQIYNFMLKATDTIFRNTTGTAGSTIADNGTITNGGACPAFLDGDHYLSSQTYTYNASYFSGLNGVRTSNGATCASGNTDCVQRYLASATEIVGDDIGDEDGLCESGEACLYTPNFGAYQGHGALQSCVFTDGAVTGVKMYYYSTDGY